MGRRIAIESFQLQRDVEERLHGGIAVALFLQLGLAVDGLLQRHRVGGVVGDEFGQPVDLSVGHLQHPAHIACHHAGLQLAEGDDLGHAIGAVALLHIGDDLVAPVLAEVDVEVRHRDALGIEEALEQKVEPEGIEVGDRQRVSHQEPAPEPRPGPTGMPFDFAYLMKSDTIRK